MSVTVTASQKPPNERDKLRGQLDRMTGEFRVALPEHIPPERFKRVILTAVQQTPDLMAADRRSLLMAATKCATDGLLPDGREAAFVVFNTKVKEKFQRQDGSEGEREVWKKLAQYMPMRAGVQKRAYNTGAVLSLQGHVIHENDHFIWSQGTDEKLEHRPLFPGDRGQIIGAYAVAHLKSQEKPLFRVMDKARIEKARAVSRAANGPAWREWWDEMAIKTVIRNLAKDLPAGSEIEELIRRDDEAPDPQETTETIDGVLADDAPQLSPPDKLGALEGKVIDASGEPPPHLFQVTRETVE
jgi:recombination protein RecT